MIVVTVETGMVDEVLTDEPLRCRACGCAFEEDGDGLVDGDIEICEGCGLVLCGDCRSEMAERSPKLCDNCLKQKGS